MAARNLALALFTILFIGALACSSMSDEVLGVKGVHAEKSLGVKLWAKRRRGARDKRWFCLAPRSSLFACLHLST
jgi:hypothetical protein